VRAAHRNALIGASAAVMAATAAFVAPWEGTSTTPYRDIVGKWTVCTGETNIPMRTYTKDECAAILADALPKYYGEIAACWGPDVESRLTNNQRVAFTSGAYNFGTGAFCKSSMVRALKAGDMVGSCHALRMYNRAGGKVVKGLDNRRRAEEKLCLEGL
jgi:lysozyme